MKTLRSVDSANKRIESIIDEATRTVLGKTTLKQLLSKGRTRVMAEINTRLNQKIKEDKMGVEIVDVRIVRADLGEALRDSTVRRMVSEMVERATETRAKGEQLALEIRSGAEKERTVILAEAERDAQVIRGEGDKEAIQTYAAAFNKDKEFYSFMRSMEAYKNTLADPETRMILSPDSDFFRYFEKRR
jgi:membrane protease subunit HflC